MGVSRETGCRRLSVMWMVRIKGGREGIAVRTEEMSDLGAGGRGEV